MARDLWRTASVASANWEKALGVQRRLSWLSAHDLAVQVMACRFGVRAEDLDGGWELGHLVNDVGREVCAKFPGRELRLWPEMRVIDLLNQFGELGE